MDEYKIFTVGINGKVVKGCRITPNVFTTIEELDVISQHKHLRSLQYFPNQVNLIREKIKGIINQSEDVIILSSTEEGEYEVKEGVSYSVMPTVSMSNKANTGVYIPNTKKTEHQKKRIGDNSERIVYNELVGMYGVENVIHVSKLNEGLHYDMRYHNPDSGLNKYVEVKTMSGNSFHLTYDEKLFGEAHKDDYEIWLVNHKRIIPLKDFFLNNGYSLTPKEYLVRLNIDLN